MAMVVKNNMSAVRTLNTLNTNSNALQGSLAKVSSGMKINSAQDDASGYAISERMRVQIRSLDQANQNTQNGSSLMKTAEGAVSKTVEILKSLKEKAISAATDTNTDSDRVTIQKEIDQFIDQIDDNALVTFNGKYLVDGSKTQAGKATYTAMTNQSMATDTAGGTALTDLKNRNNESLEIASTDYVTASFVKDGKTFTTKYQVGSTKLEDVFSNLNNVATDAGIGEVFGAANIPVEGVSFADTGAAVSKITDAGTDTLVKALDAGTTDTDAKAVQAAVSYLQSKNVAFSGTGLASVDSTTDALVTDIGTFVNGTKLTTKANGGEVASGHEWSVDFTYAKYDSSGASETATLATVTGTNSGTVTSGNAGPDLKLADTQTGTAVSVLMESVKNAVASKASSDPQAAGKAVFDSVASDTSTFSCVKDSTENANGKADTWTGGTVPTTSLENYTKAVLYEKLFSGGGDLVNATSEVGLAASGDMTTTANGEVGLTVTAKSDGLKGQVSGLAISITDSTGNVKKSANASLDAFSTTIFAANESDDNALKFHVGATANLSITVGLADMRSEALGLKGSDGSKVSVATQSKANAAVATFDNALQKALDIQTTIGAVEARLDYTSSNLTTSSENVQAAESTIRDADMAKEMTNYTKNNVLLQAAQSMLAQANQNSSAVLSLLQ